MRNSSIVDVHILCRKGNGLLFQLRSNTGYQDGLFHFPAGHLEADETVVEAAIREAREELGIVLTPDALRLAFVLHQNSAGSRIGFFFETIAWQGSVAIMEPDKCAKLEWLDAADMPENIVPYARFVAQEMSAGRKFGVFGWYPQNELSHFHGGLHTQPVLCSPHPERDHQGSLGGSR